MWGTLRENAALLDGRYRKRVREWLGATTGADLTSEPHEQRVCRDLIERLLELKKRSNEVRAKCRELLRSSRAHLAPRPRLQPPKSKGKGKGRAVGDSE